MSYSRSCLYEFASCCTTVSADAPIATMPAPSRSMAQAPDTHLLPLSLDLSVGSEVRLHGLRRSVVEKTANTASSTGAGRFACESAAGVSNS